MDINTEECTNFTPIKNCEESGKQNRINGYISEDTYSNCSANSNELFSDDDENEDDLMYYSPNVSKSTDPSFLNISETSLLHSNKQALTPGFDKSAVIPKTPLGLLPFLTRVNEPWTSDLETPQTNKYDQKQINMDRSLQSSNEKSVSASKQYTPNTSNVKNQFNEVTCTSPVINCKRVRRRTKRRIFKTTSIAVDTAINPNHCEDLVVPIIQDNHEQHQLQVIKENNDDVDNKNNSKSQDISPTENNASTQEFFCNASFANIDEICANFAEKNESTENNNKRKFVEDISEDNVKEKESISYVDVKKNIDYCSKVVPLSNVGFSTASGKHIDISDSAIAKAKSLLEEDDTSSSTKIPVANTCDIKQSISYVDVKKNIDYRSKVAPLSNVGFSTASGKHIDISDSAISKAKSLLQEDDTSSSTKIPVVNTSDIKQTTNKESFQPLPLGNKDNNTVSFSTARGQVIKPSEKAVKKACALFADEIDDVSHNSTKLPLENSLHVIKKSIQEKHNLTKQRTGVVGKRKIETTLSNKIPLKDRSNSAVNSLQTSTNVCNLKSKKQLSSSLFVTARGQTLSISEKALSNAKKMLIEEVENNTQITKSMLNTDDLLKAELCSINQSNKTVESVQSSKSVNSNLKEPFIHPVVVPNVGFSIAAGRKVTVSKEAVLKAEKLLSDDISDTGKCSNLLNESINKRKSVHVCDGTLDKLSSLNVKKVKLSEENTTAEKENKNLNESVQITQSNNTFSNEIMASAAALLADEKDNDQNIEWISQIERCEQKEKCKTPSPVIGRQPVPRRRGKKRSLQFTEKQTVISSNKDDTNINIKKPSCISTCISTNETTVKNVEDPLQKRLEAISKQERIIKEKKFNRPKVTVGKLLSYKEENRNARFSWKKLVGDDVPKLCTFEELINQDMSAEILKITAATALSYKFQTSHLYGENIIEKYSGCLEMEDGGYIVPDEDGYIGIIEIKESFLATPGVDPCLLPTGWVENHYKWIIWKLASMDRIKFKSISLPRTLTPANVMLQLKYRYDREIDRLQRPCLRRILEKDDSASQRMVLCVSSVMQTNPNDIENNEQSPKISGINHWRLLLTDGWYCVPASIDVAMINYITSGKVREGTKLMIFGAELLNLDQGCPPLEIPSDVCLKIYTNSTRRARWDTKLGYTSNPGPMLIKLKNVCPLGGLIGKIKVVVARTYPMLFHEKNILGESVLRNSRSEEKANVAYEEECRSRIEAFYAEAEKKFEEKGINEHQTAEKFKQKLESKLRESLPPPRQVSPILKVRVTEEDTSAILKIWAPSEEIVDILKEGTSITIRNVFASGKRAGDLQLTACRNTSFNKEKMCKNFPQSRVYTPLQIVSDSSFNPLYGEFDTVGIVSSIVTNPFDMKNFEAVNIACPHDNAKETTPGSSYLSILFWQGVSAFGYAEILTMGSLVACSNLEWRRATSWNIPVAYCTDRTVFTRNPRQSHLCQAFENLKNLIKIPHAAYAAKSAEEISLETQKRAALRVSLYGTPDKSTPNKASQNMDSSKLIGSNSRSDVRNANVNPIKSAAIQRRLEKLHYYSNPPELSPLVLKNSSTRVSLDFRSPIQNDNFKPTKLNMDP